MAQGTYIAMSGAIARAEQLDNIANNLANAETPGFKANRVAFQAFLPPGSNGASTYVGTIAAGVDPRAGTLMATDNPMDLVPGGEAYFAIQLPSGVIAYTRDGRIAVGVDGTLQTPAGLLLDRNNRPIVVGNGITPTVTQEGSVFVGSTEAAVIGRYTFDGELERLTPSVVRPLATTQTLESQAEVLVGQLELGNVSTLSSMVELISAQRNFDTAMQAIETYKKLGQASCEVGRVR